VTRRPVRGVHSMTTSKLAAIVAGSLVFVLTLALGALVLRPVDTFAAGSAVSISPAGVATLSALPSPGQPDQQPASQELVNQINRLVQARRATYQQQLDELSSRVQNGQAQIKRLEAQEQALQQQLTQLKAARIQRQAEYRQQLETANRDLEQHYAQYNAQYQEIEARLAQANALLGR
jgi:membrane protein involved in colicin uptake